MLRRLARLDVSIDMAVHWVLLWVLMRGAIRLVAVSDILGCGSAMSQYTFDIMGWFTSGRGWLLGLVVVGVAWLEMHHPLRPWFKRALRLSGPLFMASLLICLWLTGLSIH